MTTRPRKPADTDRPTDPQRGLHIEEELDEHGHPKRLCTRCALSSLVHDGVKVEIAVYVVEDAEGLQSFACAKHARGYEKRQALTAWFKLVEEHALAEDSIKRLKGATDLE